MGISGAALTSSRRTTTSGAPPRASTAPGRKPSSRQRSLERDRHHAAPVLTRRRVRPGLFESRRRPASDTPGVSGLLLHVGGSSAASSPTGRALEHLGSATSAEGDPRLPRSRLEARCGESDPLSAPPASKPTAEAGSCSGGRVSSDPARTLVGLQRNGVGSAREPRRRCIAPEARRRRKATASLDGTAESASVGCSGSAGEIGWGELRLSV